MGTYFNIQTVQNQTGLAPLITDPSPNSFNTLFKKILHVTNAHDMWYVTCDTLHMTGERWEEVNLLSKFQLPSFQGLGVRGYM